MVYQWLLWSYVIQWWVESYGEASQLVSILNVKLNLLNPRKRLVKEYLLCQNSNWSVCNEFSPFIFVVFYTIYYIKYISILYALFFLSVSPIPIIYDYSLFSGSCEANSEHVTVKMINGDSYVRIKWTSAAYGMLL